MEQLKELGVTGWPAAIVASVSAICFVSLWIGWPWSGIIVKHYHCEKCNCCEDDDD